MMKMTLSTILLLFTQIICLAQVNISGVVTDDSGEPLIGANVFIKGSYDGSSTGIDGRFSFATEANGTIVLMFSYLGFEEKAIEIDITNQHIDLNVKMKESINKMEAVVISAGVFQGGVGAKREVLKPLDIVTTAGATADIAGALNTLPGTQTVGEEGRLFVRGGTGEETKTFIDGLQVLKPYSTTIPNTPTRGRFSPFMFSGTSFSTGGYSAEYGQALSSALILKTKEKPSQTRTDLSLMTVGTEISHTQSWSKSSVAVQGAYYNMKPYFSVVKQSTDWLKEPESMQFNMAARQLVGTSGILKVYANLSTNNFKLNQPDILNSAEFEQVSLRNDFSYVNTSFKNTIGDKWMIKTGIAGTFNQDDIALTEENIEETTRGMHAKLTFAGDVSSNLSINLGSEYLYSESKQDYKRADGFNNVFSYKNPSIATFIEADYYLSNNLVTRAGIRVEHNSLTKTIYAAPRLSISLKTGENSQVALAAGRFQQSPFDEALRINNNLQNERADHLILNYQFLTSKQTFRIEGYFKRYHDLVKFNSDMPYDPRSYTNSGDGYAQGIDLFWRDNKSIRNADYWISYSYLFTERDYRDFPTKATPNFASKHNLSVVYKHFITGWKTQLGGTFTFGSPRPYNDPNSQYFNAQHTPAYIDLSLSASYLASQSIIVHASVTNVLGRENIFGYTYSDKQNATGGYVGIPNKLPAPRFLFVGVFITFSKDSTLNQMKSL